MTKRTQFLPPPRDEIDRLNTDAHLLELTCIHMTIARPQRAIRAGFPSIFDRHDPIYRQRHDLPEYPTHLVFGHAVVAGELEDLRHGSGVGVVLGVPGDVDAHPRDVCGVGRRADRPVVHLHARLLLRLPQRVQQDVDRRLGIVVFWVRLAVQHGHTQRGCLGVFLHRAFSVEFRLPVDVRGFRRRGRRVRCFALHPREYVVRRDVDQECVVG